MHKLNHVYMYIDRRIYAYISRCRYRYRCRCRYRYIYISICTDADAYTHAAVDTDTDADLDKATDANTDPHVTTLVEHASRCGDSSFINTYPKLRRDAEFRKFGNGVQLCSSWFTHGFHMNASWFSHGLNCMYLIIAHMVLILLICSQST